MADAQVTAWLRHAGLSRFTPRFTAALVSRNAFLHLSPTDLDALGVDAPSDRKRLLDLIADLRRATSLPPHLINTRSRSPRAVQRSRSFNRPMPMDPSQGQPLSDRNSHLSPPADDTISLSGTSDTGRRNRRHSRNSSLSMSMTSVRDSSISPKTTPTSAFLARVKVCVRKRPLSRKEQASSNRDIVTVQSPDHSLFVHELKERVDLTKYVDTHAFTFDRVFAEQDDNAAVYDGTARPLVDALFEGGRSTCFAYGQTGAGKTFTMAGGGPQAPGLYTLAIRDVFDRIRNIERDQWMEAEAQGIDDFEPPDPIQVWISFYEIYASKLQDLLNCQTKLECREDSNNEVQIVGLTEQHCEVEEEVLDFIQQGSAARSTGVTGANDDSSRSHAVFQIELRHPPDESAPVDPSTAMRKSLLKGARNHPQPLPPRGAEIGRLCFIDLAGSERGSDTASSTRQTRMEGAEINKSLLALKECIRAMDKKKDHTPFRGSKLTQVLKASFIGKNCRTVMIANISPASSNVEHTLNTLRYSDRVKEIKAVKSNAGDANGVKVFGGRRATFSHGIGLRAGRNAPMSTPMKKSSPQKASNIEQSEPEAAGTELRPGISTDSERMPDRPRDSEDSLNAVPRASSRLAAGRRTFTRTRGQVDPDGSPPMPGTATKEPQSTTKGRESRLLRRRNSRTPSQIPSRPSLSTGAPTTKGEVGKVSKVATEEKMPAANSVPADSSSCEDVTQMATPQVKANPRELTRSRSLRSRKDGKSGTSIQSAIKLRQKKREGKAASPRGKRSESGVPSKENAVPDETERAKGSLSSLRTPLKSGNSTNVAQSAMKHYWTNRKDELGDDDLLFPSCDDLRKHISSEVRERLGAVSLSREEAGENMEASSGKEVVAGDGESSTSMDDDERSDSPSPGKKELQNVIRLHHVQIEELMRLTEADVALVNAAEKGEIDSQEYALKLGLNLSQKVDIVKALQSKLKQLK